eukprot:EG_transcript_16885
MGKRQGYIGWEDYFMGIALLSAQRSKDPVRQVGCCLVSGDRKIVGIGYNGFPLGCSDDALPWEGAERQPHQSGASASMVLRAEMLDTKYPYVCHAELNAIINSNMTDLSGCTMYVTTHPCNECAKLIIQSKVRRVRYLTDPHHADPVWVAARRLFALAKVDCTQYHPSRSEVSLELLPTPSSTNTTPFSSPAKPLPGRPATPAAPEVLADRLSPEVAGTVWPRLAGAAAVSAGLALCCLRAYAAWRRA